MDDGDPFLIGKLVIFCSLRSQAAGEGIFTCSPHFAAAETGALASLRLNDDSLWRLASP